jgi:hypothetical protein
MRRIVELGCAVLGAINLGFYAWGSHDPASLAVGIWCLFAVLWQPGRQE